MKGAKMSDNTWGEEINDSSRKNNKGYERRMKEKEHWNKSKSPKHGQLHQEPKRSKGKELVNKYMHGSIDDFDDYDER